MSDHLLSRGNHCNTFGWEDSILDKVQKLTLTFDPMTFKSKEIIYFLGAPARNYTIKRPKHIEQIACGMNASSLAM